MALMQMGNCRKGTPTEGLNVITGTLPMELWIEQQVLNVQVRLQTHIPNEDWAKNPRCHLGRGKILLDQLRLNTLSLDNYVKDLNFTQNYKVDTDSFAHGDDAYDHNKYNCYTDGSKYKDQTGQGGIIYYPGQQPAEYGTWSKRGHNQNTVFQMEVEAIRFAAMALKSLWVESPEGPNVATIFVDNQASLKALNKYEIASTETHDAKTALNEAGLLGSITLRWIKAHVGYAGNEEADILAKEGSQLSCELKNFGGTRISRGACKGVIKAHIQARWESMWYQRKDCRQTKIFVKEPDAKMSKALMDTSRENYGRLIRWVTGHNHLKRQNTIIDGEGSKYCRHCESEPETSGHIITSCEAFCKERGDSFLNHWLNPQSPQWNVPGLLKFLSCNRVKQLEEASEPPNELDD
jgi:ribonuclease HI